MAVEFDRNFAEANAAKDKMTATKNFIMVDSNRGVIALNTRLFVMRKCWFYDNRILDIGYDFHSSSSLSDEAADSCDSTLMTDDDATMSDENRRRRVSAGCDTHTTTSARDTTAAVFCSNETIEREKTTRKRGLPVHSICNRISSRPELNQQHSVYLFVKIVCAFGRILNSLRFITK